MINLLRPLAPAPPHFNRRVSHLEPSPIAPGMLPLPQDVLAAQQQQAAGANLAARGAAAAGATGATGAGMAVVVPWGYTADGGAASVPRLQPVQLDNVLLENFTEQVRFGAACCCCFMAWRAAFTTGMPRPSPQTMESLMQ